MPSTLCGRMLHVTTQGASIGQAGGRLEVRKDETVLLSVPITALRSVLLYGDVRPTKGALRLCLDENVSITLLTRQGRFRGRLVGKGDSGVAQRMRQWLCSQNPAFCLAFSRLLVQRKVEAALALWQLRRKSPGTDRATSRALQDALNRVRGAASLDQLRGMEGASARAWFAQIRQWLPRAWSFSGRDRKHPDPANALLNLGYTLLCREWESLLAAADFEPALGFYHALAPGRPSLACDLMEEFRPVVDRLVLNVANRSLLTERDFEQRDSGMRLKPEALRVFLRAYEEQIALERATFARRITELADRLRQEQPGEQVRSIPPGRMEEVREDGDRIRADATG